MVTSLYTTMIVSIVLGFLSGLGTGGGSLLILWLTIVLHAAPDTARAMNLLFFLPSALVAILFRWKQGTFSIKKVVPAILAGCASAFLFSKLRPSIDTAILEKLFGGLLLFTGIRELTYRKK